MLLLPQIELLQSHLLLFLPAQDSDAVQLDVTTKEKDSAKMRPLHADSKSADKYGLFNADAWIKNPVRTRILCDGFNLTERRACAPRIKKFAEVNLFM